MGKKQKNCDPANPEDDHRGDYWDHVAFDREHKLVLAVVPGARVTESVVEVVTEVKDRLGEQPPALATSDEYAVYQTVIEEAFSQPVAGLAEVVDDEEVVAAPPAVGVAVGVLAAEAVEVVRGHEASWADPSR